MSRYVVTRLEGHLEPVYGGLQDRSIGVSCMVSDTAVPYVVIATYRSEDYSDGRSRAEAWAQAERLENEHALRLNG